ncbi:sigma-70 family RNA polymerase sigma factor [Marinisporobacter balticus]|uniref:RNA polymerase sigma-30 (SigH) subunit n=1 Tax=Marinisporobacter balticus TaxID=2018667 RepID=A0A4R2KS97_9FIRM|nr:sigma-70 family RNA polymerase sigma factor [Marinisporobacter balticus]TCO69535.1 RNA polymerase sigma-30 (SigH) subunit [Marinisporobacter balticus]
MRKLIIIGKDQASELSFEEVYERYENLVYKRAQTYRNFYDIDDLKQTARIGLWNAYKKYDVSTGTAFGAFADKVITNELRMFNRVRNVRFTRKTAKVKGLSSLEEKLDNSEVQTVSDLIVDQTDFTEKIIEKDIVVRAIDRIQKLSPKEQYIIFSYIKGVKQRVIAEKIGVTQTAVAKVISRKLKGAS